MKTMLPTLEDAGVEPSHTAQPLAIAVTDGGALVVQMHALLRQITPVLEQPDSVPESFRQELAARANALLAGLSDEELICVCLYRKGAENVVRLLQTYHRSPQAPSSTTATAEGGTPC